jgi:hypothetical protein
MKRLFVPLALFLLAVPAITQADTTPACIKSRGEARARVLGYDHVVTIENACDKAATCTVTTDVAPDPITTKVDAKKTVELTTFRGSPASTFKPRVSCKLR